MGYVTYHTICPPTNPSHTFWIQQDHLLQSTFVASFILSLINFIALTNSSHETWTNLATMHAKPSHGHIMGICETLSKIMKDTKSIFDYT